MQTFIIKSIVIFSLIFCVVYVTKRYKAHIYYDKITMMILGPSHTYRSVNTSMLDYQVINKSQGGIPIDECILIYWKNITNYPNIKYILFDLSQGYLDGRANETKSLYQKKIYQWLINNRFDFLVKYINVSLPLKNELKIITNKDYLKTSFGKIEEQRKVFEHLKRDIVKIDTSRQSWEIINKHNNISNNNMQESIRDLENIINDSKKRNIKFIFISPPKYKLYNDCLIQVHAINREKIVNKFVDNKNVFFWNYETFHEQDPNLFFNVNHMNPEGANLFTNQFNKDLKKAFPQETTLH